MFMLMLTPPVMSGSNSEVEPAWASSMTDDVENEDIRNRVARDDRVPRAFQLVEHLVELWQEPTWSQPVQAFMDEESFAFSRQAMATNISQVRMDSRFRDAHQRYVTLVAPLLAEHLRGCGITIDEFERIVESTSDNPELTDVIPDHVRAVRDYDVFVRVMVDRNDELDRESRALYNSTACVPEDTNPDGTAIESDIVAVLIDSANEARAAGAVQSKRVQRERHDVSVALAASLLDEAERARAAKRAAELEEAELAAALAASLSCAEEDSLQAELASQQTTNLEPRSDDIVPESLDDSCAGRSSASMLQSAPSSRRILFEPSKRRVSITGHGLTTSVVRNVSTYEDLTTEPIGSPTTSVHLVGVHGVENADDGKLQFRPLRARPMTVLPSISSPPHGTTPSDSVASAR